MNTPVNGSHHTPLGCRWVMFAKRGDALRVSNWTRALCVRVPEIPRIVTEADCTGCKYWEPKDDARVN